MRTVTDTGWPYEYRALVVKHDGWFRKGWKYVIEQKWVHWRHYETSWSVFKTKEQAWDAANGWLDAHDCDVLETEREYVPERDAYSQPGSGA